jgi:ABC-2 type transport system permease protein
MDGDWPGTEIAWTLGWAGVIVAIFGPVTMRLYARK